jgi:hypothetical protein
MSVHAQQYFGTLEEVRVELACRLRTRRAELQEAVFDHVRVLSEDLDDGEHAEYIKGMQMAVVEALDHVLMGIERGDEWSAPIPAAAAEQARRAARHGVSLDTVLRRYAAGERQLVEFIMDDAHDLSNQALRQLLKAHGQHVDRFMAAVAAEYMDELDRVARSPEQRITECVERLLVGEPVETGRLGYDIEGRWHVGLVVMGVGAEKAVKALVDVTDRQVLSVPRSEQTVWVWLGGRHRPVMSSVERLVSNSGFVGMSLAIGEPAIGLEGWRMTHRQAQAAVWVALRKSQQVTRYADDLLLAAALRDEVLAKSLHDIYCAPLGDQKDGGAVLCETLRAYFATGRNAATAAALLRVDRHTVQRRLRKVEERLDRLLDTCYAELEVALRLQELGDVEDTGSESSVQLAAAELANGGSHRA